VPSTSSETVAAAVDDGQAAVLAGDEDATLQGAGGSEEPGRQLRSTQVDRGAVDPVDSPTLQTGEVTGLVAVVDVDQMTLQEASSAQSTPLSVIPMVADSVGDTATV
jgi:hypothetical protein